MDEHRKQVAERVDEHRALALGHLFPPVEPALAARFGRLDALAVDNPGARLGGPPVPPSISPRWLIPLSLPYCGYFLYALLKLAACSNNQFSIKNDPF